MAKKRTYREFKQGIYKPINRAKCVNKDFPVYRSGLEAKLMRVLDKEEKVRSWGSENVVIPYKKPGNSEFSRYFVDFFMELVIDGQPRKFLIEVKPHKQCLPPTSHGNKKQSTIIYENMQYAINQCKWEAAKKWCANKGYTFLVITEKNIDTILGK